MKIHKKFGLGLALITVTVIAAFFSPPKALASPIKESDFTRFPYEVVGFSNGNQDPTLNGKIDNLKITIKTDIPTFPGNDYFFVDTNTKDDTNRLEYYGSGGVLCRMEKGQGGDLFGIKITDGPTQGSDGKTYFQAIIGIGYSGDTTKPCSKSGADQFIQPPGASIKVFYSTSLPGAPTPTTVCSAGSTDPKCVTTPPPGDGTGGAGGGATGSNDACYSSGWELSWLACPLITAAQTAANGMYSFVENQLKFSVSPDSKLDGKTTDSLGKEHDSVHQVWSNFRILVSGLVVILLLVMVISQAIGTGPFDAYTVKKMLPRLVIGVILIQISWPIFSWVINTVDDLGRGLADIMYAPFGGSEALNLNSVMKPFVIQGEVFSWVGIPALAVFAVVAPFIVIGLILTVLVAIFVGFLTLLFRKIIIILALIFVPVALISWMMPNDGLRKYWKLWWDNFIKALMMFPLIVVMIAAGRIFAKIGSGQGGDFVGFFIVLVGFFGPLFILPKTFKWGGTAMAAAGSALQKAQTSTTRKQKDFLTNPEKGVGGWWARRQGLHASEYTDQDSFRKRFTNSLKAGRIIPTRRAKGAMIFRGNEYKSKENELEKAIQERRREKAASRSDNVMAGKQKDLDAITEGAAEAVAAQKLGLLGTQKKAERKAKEAMRDLIATGSTLELNNAVIVDADGKTKKVWQTKMWRDLLNGSPDLYRQVKGDAPDWVPHRTPLGLPKYRGELTDDQKAEARQRGMTEDAFYQWKNGVTPEQHELLKTDQEAQWASSLHETVTELDAGNLATLHPTYYERIGDAARQGQKYLHWAETGIDGDGRAIAEPERAQLRIKAAQMQRPAIEFGLLIKRLSKESSSRQYLTRAMGGADTMEHLDAALQFSQVRTGERPGEGELLINPDEPKGVGSMEKIVEWGRIQEAALMRGGGGAGGTPVPPAAGGETEIRIEHEEPPPRPPTPF